MNVEIITKPLALNIFGVAGVASNKDYAGAAFKASGKMWQIVKQNNLKNKGLNIWVYEPADKVFAGVELEERAEEAIGLEHMLITLTKYAYFKHVGPYHLIKTTGQNMTEVLRAKGYETTLPYIEIYGHWNKDDTKLETELLMSLK
jgi:predicted transcriptional regulator YdeE